jgi:lysophospholipase L1-like esterase
MPQHPLAAPQGSARRLFRHLSSRALAVVLPLVVVGGLLEGVTRLLDPTLGAYRAIRFGGDPNSPALFMTDPRLHWKLRPDVKLAFQGVEVRTDRDGFRNDPEPAGERVVLALGDSTTFGWSVEQAETFPARLEALLNTAAGAEPTWRVFNAGVPGYTSLQLRILAERLVPALRPDVVVVSVGNNEAWPVVRSDREVDEHGRLAAAVVRLLSASRFLVWAAETLRPQRTEPFKAPSLVGAVPRVGVDEYAANLEALIRTARRAGAEVVLLAPTVNLYAPLLNVEQLPDSDAMQEYNQHILTLLDAKQFETARLDLEEKIEADPEDLLPLWWKGIYLTTVAREVMAGRDWLERALERNPFPERSNRSYRRIFERVAEREQSAYVDPNQLFLARSLDDPNATPPWDLYLDHCHPTSEGHRVIAEALFRELAALREMPREKPGPAPPRKRTPAAK